jgi:hypothetical protein
MAQYKHQRTPLWNNSGMSAERPFTISASWSEGAKPSRPRYHTDLPPIAELNANGMPGFIYRTPTERSGGPTLASPIERLFTELDALLLNENSGWQVQLPSTERGNRTAQSGPRQRSALTAVVAVMLVGVAGSVLLDRSNRNSQLTHSHLVNQARPISAALEPRSRSIVIPSTASPKSDQTPTNRPALSDERPTQSGSWSESAGRPNEVMPASITAGLHAAAVDPYAGRVAIPLTGNALESALIADRIATKERNLEQLGQLRRSSENTKGAEGSGKWR